jgi:glycosyltransferase involved in cell wall biosynthesis
MVAPMPASNLVSVVIPTYNRRVQVREAVESVLAQRGCEIEVIVVDDGSTDGTDDALADLELLIRYEKGPHRGVSAARNAGAAGARGRWLAFLDSDDLWMPDKLRAQLAFHAAAPKVLLSQTQEIWIRNGVRVNPCRHHAKPSGDVFVPSLERCLISPSAVMIRRDLFLDSGGFAEDLPVCEDYDLWLRLSCRQRVGLIDRSLVVKRGGHADQLSRQYWGMDRFRVVAIDRLLSAQVLDGRCRAAALRVLRDKCRILAQGAARRGREEEARSFLELAERHLR